MIILYINTLYLIFYYYIICQSNTCFEIIIKYIVFKNFEFSLINKSSYKNNFFNRLSQKLYIS